MTKKPNKDAPTPTRSSAEKDASPGAVRDLRARLTVGEEVVDPETWAGSIPASSGIVPRIRIGTNRWFNLLWLIPIGFVVLVAGIAVAKGLRTTVKPSAPRRPRPQA